MAIHSPKHKLTRTDRGWVKRINGKPTWICSRKVALTPEEADAYYERHFAALWADSAPAIPAVARTVKDVFNLYLDRKRRAGIAERTFNDYIAALGDFADTVGGGTDVEQLTPADFAKARAAWAKRFGPDRLSTCIVSVRSAFKWARKPPLRLPGPDYGDEFDQPRRADFRRARKAAREKHGPKLFTADEVQTLLAVASRTMKAMILLAVNGGFGNTDLAELPRSIVNLDRGFIDYARGKTGIERRVPLWDETRKAVRAVLDYVPKSRARPEAWAAPVLLFQTRTGRPYIEERRSRKGKPLHKDRIGTQFNVLCRACGLSRFGRGFYSLRRTFRTLADEFGDQRAAAKIMGHEPADIGNVYVQHVSDERLSAVVQHVRSKLGFRDSPGPGRQRQRGGGGAAKRERRK